MRARLGARFSARLRRRPHDCGGDGARERRRASSAPAELVHFRVAPRGRQELAVAGRHARQRKGVEERLAQGVLARRGLHVNQPLHHRLHRHRDRHRRRRADPLPLPLAAPAALGPKGHDSVRA
eukprot:scaffold9692_cov96-Isochrysis_galbana.AAC.2